MPEVTIQPDGSAGIDTWLDEFNQATNRGTEASFKWGRDDSGAGGSRYVPIIKFDLSSIPKGSIIQVAQLTMIAYSWGSTFNTQATFNRVLSGNSDWTETGANWDTKDGTNAWAGSEGAQTAGTDYDDDDVLLVQDMTVSPFNGTGTHTFTFSPTAFQKFIDVGNHGFVMRPTYGASGSSTGGDYRSAEYTTAADRPKLFIRYLAPSGRLVEYTFNIWDPDRRILDSKGEVVPPDEIRPDRWIRFEGIELPRGKHYDSLVEDPTTSYIVGVTYDEERRSVRIVTNRNQFAELIVRRLAGGS